MKIGSLANYALVIILTLLLTLLLYTGVGIVGTSIFNLACIVLLTIAFLRYVDMAVWTALLFPILTLSYPAYILSIYNLYEEKDDWLNGIPYL